MIRLQGKKSGQGERKGGKGSNFVVISIVIKVIPHKKICLWSKTKKNQFVKNLHPLEDKQLQSDTARTLLQG